MPVNVNCLNRLSRLLDLIPFDCSGDYPASARLLEKMADSYAGSDGAARRRIERDLDELLQTGQIEVTNPGGKPRFFRRLANDPANDPRLLEYIKALSSAMLNERLPSRRNEQLWARLRDSQQRPLLAETRFRAISDSQRLLPAAIKPEVLVAVLAALIQRQALRVGYRKPDGSLQKPLLHAQGLLQRGPILYLYALKNDEDHIKMFALHRMTSASLETETARDAHDFDLDQRIHDGDADFGGGEQVKLELLVSGYVLTLLEDCPLSEDQVIEDIQENEGLYDILHADAPAFSARVTATLPATGQLYRWLIGCGANIAVIAPAILRDVVARTANATALLYR